jgi:hypothetical protein
MLMDTLDRHCSTRSSRKSLVVRARLRPELGHEIPDRHCQGFSSARSSIVERLRWLTDSGIGCAQGCVLTTRSTSIICQVRHCSGMAGM